MSHSQPTYHTKPSLQGMQHIPRSPVFQGGCFFPFSAHGVRSSKAGVISFSLFSVSPTRPRCNCLSLDEDLKRISNEHKEYYEQHPITNVYLCFLCAHNTPVTTCPSDPQSESARTECSALDEDRSFVQRGIYHPCTAGIYTSCAVTT